ncbi:MAG: hypothetical protein D3924_01420 [Candidatus Electrothrix sp. AR4]|nr:hypothetical protein [Candidatus Electrothrix sp. AR4]
MRKTINLFMSILAVFILCSCDLLDDDDDQATSSSGAAVSAPTEIRLSAFSFDCTQNWTNRDGALGLKAYSGGGSCQTVFSGVSAKYNIQIKVQTEHDGAPPYAVAINGTTVKAGRYPYATGVLACDCSINECPDRNTYINIGTFQVNTEDIIRFTGDQVFPCGGEHGAYAKWHEMVFTPQE